MFTLDFFPANESIIDMMDFDCRGKKVLEPQAGSCKIVDYLWLHGAKEVFSCENHPELQLIAKERSTFLTSDFFSLKAEQVSHINSIIMNPPFSNADRHILHAFEIAPEGCEIVSLCNWETLNNRYSRSREGLEFVIEQYGNSSNLGKIFQSAERRTDVEVGLVKLYKPVSSEAENLEGFYLNEDPEQHQENAVMNYDEITAIVNSYIASVKCFNKVREVANELNSYTGITGFGDGISFKMNYSDNRTIDPDTFKKEMQKHCWKYVFKRMNINKHVTKGVMETVNKFVENQQNVPFTIRNIYRMIEIIVGTKDQTMQKAIVEAVDNFTKHTHENRYCVEGWKTNSGYMLNMKFIVSYISEPSFRRGLSIKTHYSNYERLEDLNKALCYLTGTNYDDIRDIRKTPIGEQELEEWKVQNKKKSYDHPNYGSFEAGQWYSWHFFDFKIYKKGSGHFKFKDKKVWELLNRTYAKIKGQVLPEGNMKQTTVEFEDENYR